MALVEARLVALFGPYAGWAHTALFIAELRGQREALPAHLRTPAGHAPAGHAPGGVAAAAARKKSKKAKKEEEGAEAVAAEAATTERAPKKARAKGADAKPAAKRRLEAAAAPAA
jgi:hypothetical protein